MGLGRKMGQGLAMALMSFGNALTKQNEKKSDFDLALQLVGAKAAADKANKDPTEELSGPLRDIVLSQSPAYQERMRAAGYPIPDVTQLTPKQMQYMKLRAAGGVGSGVGAVDGALPPPGTANPSGVKRLRVDPKTGKIQ